MPPARKDLFQYWPEGYQAIAALNQLIADTGLDPSLVELIRLRVSQINGCGYCIDRHAKDARTNGETEQRLYALSAWQESPFFSERERVALAMAEAVTQVSDHQLIDRAVQEAARHFVPEQLTWLLYAMIEINAWNRLAITVSSPEPGTYQPNPDRAS
jgi:AhpD family alkylhydroperoxidase